MADATLPTIIAAFLAFAGSVYAVVTQRRTTREQADEAKEREKGAHQIALTKDVLEQWSKIVAAQVEQIASLQAQVATLEARSRKCEEQQVELLRRLAVLGGSPSEQQQADVNESRDNLATLAELTAKLTQYTNDLANRNPDEQG